MGARMWTRQEKQVAHDWISANTGRQMTEDAFAELKKLLPRRTPLAIAGFIRGERRRRGIRLPSTRPGRPLFTEEEIDVVLEWIASHPGEHFFQNNPDPTLMAALPKRSPKSIYWITRKVMMSLGVWEARKYRRHKNPRPKGGNGKSMWPGLKTVKISLPDDLPSKNPPGSTLRLPKDMPKFDVLSVLKRQAEELLFDWAQTAYAAMKKSVSPREQALESQNHDLGKQIAGLKGHARTLSEENTKLKAENEHLKGENRELIDECEALKDELRYLCKLREAVANTPVKRAVL